MKPLEGIKVVDLTSYLAAPTTGRVLAEWGADVVKVESFGGDPARRQAGVFNMPWPMTRTWRSTTPTSAKSS